MREWVETQIATGFSEWSGTSITASVRMSDALLKELLQETLQDASTDTADRADETPAGTMAPLIKRITHADLRTSDGAVTLDVEIRL
jgi:hypothetical protein